MLDSLIYGLADSNNLKYYRWVQTLDNNLDNMWKGLKVMFHMKLWWVYIIDSLAIWICYFLKVYLCFFAFPFTRELIYDPGSSFGLLPGLVVFVFGACSVAIPSNGGLGPWNLAIMFALSLFGVDKIEGTAFSMVCWSMQTVIIIVTGLFSAGYISLYRRRVANQQSHIMPSK